MYLALHHGRTTIILNESFPTCLRHLKMLGEALLPEVLDCIVVCICYEVLDAHILSMCLESIHQPSTIAFDLLRSRYGQEDNLCKSLTMERPENTSSQNS